MHVRSWGRTTAAAATVAVAFASIGAGATASAEPQVRHVTQHETIDQSNSSVYSDAPVPGSLTAGQFTVANESASSLPKGYSVQVGWQVVKNPANEGGRKGYQSYVSTTATPSLASSSVKYAGATNASAGKNGVANVQLTKTLAPGQGIYGTWSGAPISADGERSATMRYRVSVTAPSRTMTYTSRANTSAGELVEIEHVVTVKGGTFTYDADL